ncbi:MAG TPA: 3-deoxy-7-phosphoheptulonate synthase [Terriglobia bacterium]|nr:3-deoxy-7-phosphoheptulonate synthase [Terriglobia bacterium]
MRNAQAPLRERSRAPAVQIARPIRRRPPVSAAPPAEPAFRMASRHEGQATTVVMVAGVPIGTGNLVVIAGPCSVESRQQIRETAHRVKAAGALMLRGGAYKPRTSPYEFQGLGQKALQWLAEAREASGLPVVTEVLSPEDVDLVADYADLLQVGARNMQNYALLRRLAASTKPVLLKRGPAATIREWLLAAEYLLSGGNPNVVLCERGIRTFETATRNTLDLAGVALVKELSHLPVLVDPSHGTGQRRLVPPASRAAAAVGADGLIIEVHPRPDQALSDGEQSLDPAQFASLMTDLRLMVAACA